MYGDRDVMRVFAVLAAVFLIGAAVLAATGPQGLSLEDAVSVVNVMAVFRLHEYAMDHWPHWIWGAFAVPWLLRPAWLVPASLGIICAGFAGTRMGKQPEGKRR